ncbi:putative phosphodiesterase I [Rosa chinensis]|uniref:Purple acid phosphatase n=1 Tax=Rosa chinensis TaxID=74649 RepID=A0A2P6R2M8_ROSCH|nr:probable inactive purple acid phosphatase 2 [Rosa chinensis]PRQ40681.1 putative phosphodiesterase I [Rosa chinensis]
MAVPPPPLVFFFLLILSFFFNPTHQKPSITLNTTTLSKSGDSVLIEWSGVDSPSKLDWLGIYSPPSSRNHHFLGYKFLSSSPTWQSGSGSISLPLINLRSNYSFRIFRWSESEINPKRHDHDNNPLPGVKHLLATSPELAFESGRVPDQIHLSYTDRLDQMRVMFVTPDRDDRAVRYGLSKDSLDDVAAARVSRYELQHMCDWPANHSVGWRDPGFVHDGVMTNLKSGRRYYYKVGSDDGGWSETHSFVSRNGDSDEAVAFMFGDMGTTTPYATFLRVQDESVATVKWILRDIEALGDKPAFVSHIGDISYARGYSWLWDHFFNQIEPVATKLPYHVCIGNHEYDWPLQPWKPDWSSSIYGKDGGGECGVPYSVRFSMPGNSSEPTGTSAPATRNLYYSFDMGSVHFVYISTETNFVTGSKQREFIKRDLESVNRTKTPFVVVSGHRPMYTTSNEGRDAPMRRQMLEHLEPLFVKNNVTLALWGHVHRYERFCPMSNYTCGSRGPVHVVIGMGGQDWQPIWEPRADHPTDPIFPQPLRSMYRGGEFGYTRLVASKEKLTLSYVGNHDGQVHDSVEILASGEVLGGEAGGDGVEALGNGFKAAVNGSDGAGFSGNGSKLDSKLTLFVKGASVLVLGAFIGYVIGFVSHARKRAISENSWIPVKREEDS